MPHVNIEIKARCAEQDRVREILESHNAEYRGTDHQVDVYFNVPNGRMKLRKGDIENFLIHYDRPDQAGPKQSDVTLFKSEPESELEVLLTKALGVRVVVDKEREIYFIDFVKFHIDHVKGLGYFIEIEAIDMTGDIGRDRLEEQCNHYLALFGIQDADLCEESYSDMLLQQQR